LGGTRLGTRAGYAPNYNGLNQPNSIVAVKVSDTRYDGTSFNCWSHRYKKKSRSSQDYKFVVDFFGIY